MSKDQYDERRADQLRNELLADPETFYRKGAAYELAKEFFRGCPPDRLASLLQHPNDRIAEQAFWIASEQGVRGAIFLDDAIAALRRGSNRIRYWALEIIMFGAVNEREKEFVHIVKSLEDLDRAVRMRALELLANASEKQLTAALRHLRLQEPTSAHVAWLERLLRPASPASYEPDQIETMLQSESGVERKYGVALAHRVFETHPHLLKLAATLPDEECRSVAEHMLELHDIDSRRRQS